MRDFSKYDVWKEGMSLATKIYEITKGFPEEEKFGIVSQLRRAAISVSSNFAEGCSRSSEKEFKRFIEISIGSCFEIKTQLMISVNLGFIGTEENNGLINLLDRLSRQLNALRNKLK